MGRFPDDTEVVHVEDSELARFIETLDAGR